ncbi:MAG: alpha/beta hydrolase, partial [Actinomycetota bacterium]|nr:alpha/beta hydrolase [Actinomycetota bacterium]
MLRLNVPIERQTAEVGGARISVLLAGQPSAAPPVLAVHGFGSSAQYTWQTTGHLIGLARAGRYVIAPDLL